jgi:hypothetical protein
VDGYKMICSLQPDVDDPRRGAISHFLQRALAVHAVYITLAGKSIIPETQLAGVVTAPVLVSCLILCRIRLLVVNFRALRAYRHGARAINCVDRCLPRDAG